MKHAYIWILLITTLLACPLVSAADDWRGRSIDELILLAKDTSISNRVRAVAALAMIDNIAVIPVLEDKLKDSEWSVRRRAAEGLGRFGGLEVIIPLVDQLRSEVDLEEKQIANQLPVVYIGDKVGNLEYLQTTIGIAISDILKRAKGDQAVEIKNKLAGMMLSSAEKPRVRSVLAFSLGEVGDARAVGPLIDTVKEDISGHNRAYSAQLLGRLGDQSALPALREALDDPYETPQKHIRLVRDSAALALKKLGAH